MVGCIVITLKEKTSKVTIGSDTKKKEKEISSIGRASVLHAAG